MAGVVATGGNVLRLVISGCFLRIGVSGDGGGTGTTFTGGFFGVGFTVLGKGDILGNGFTGGLNVSIHSFIVSVIMVGLADVLISIKLLGSSSVKNMEGFILHMPVNTILPSS